MKGLLQPLLYLVIAGLVAGFGWQIYQLAEFKKDSNAAARERAKDRNQEELELLLEEGGEEVDAGAAGDVNYRAADPWDELQEANFHGYVKPEPVVETPDDDKPDEPEEAPKIPLEQLFAIEALYYDVRGSGDEVQDLSRISIRYQGSANVEPPAGYEAGGVSSFSPGDTARTRQGTSRSVASRSPGNSSPGSRSAGNRSGGGRPRTGAFPAAGASGEYAHILRVGDTLWAPHENIRLVRVDDSANFAYFAREEQNSENSEDEPEEERMAREIDGLSVSQEVLQKLIDGGYETTSQASDSGSQQRASVSPSGWQEVEETTIFRRNGETRVNFARDDPVMQDPARFFNDQVGTRSYNRGGRRGVQIVSAPPRAAQAYGVETGDILISLNGVEVGSRAEALRVGRRQFDQGRRTFNAVILRNGRQVTQTFVAPDE